LLLRSSIKIVVSVFCLSLVSSAQSFIRAEYSVGTQPNSVVSADFNRDGTADLAVTNTAGNSVSILPGRSDGGFTAGTEIAVSAGPTDIVSADFNGDGVADLAVASSSSLTVTALLGNGDGTFRRVDSATTGSQASITSGDFNRDGKTDIALAVGGSVQVLLGNGDGTFQVGSSFPTDVAPKQVRAADLNRDGILDLAIGACCQGPDVTFGAFYVAGGNGDGTFSIKFSSNQSDGTKLTVGDVTGDGLADLIMPYVGCHTPCDGVEVAINDGNFSFTRFGGGGEDGGLYYGGRGPAAVGDFNGDGKLEVASSAGPGSGAYGKGYDKVLTWDVGADGKFTTQHDYVIGTNTGLWGITSGDFNGDGKADIAVVEQRTNKVAVLLSGNAPQAFELRLSGSPQTVNAGSAAQFQYVLEATNGTLPQIQLSCSGLPTGAACAFDAPPTGAMTTGNLSISTTARTGAELRHSFGWLALALPFGLVVISARRKLMWIGLLVLVFAVVLQIGCAGVAKNMTQTNSGGGSTGGTNNSGNGSTGGVTTPSPTPSPSPTPAPTPAPAAGPTPAGSYQVTVNATGGGVTRTEVVTLVVQ
jgi:hypothetical protein